MNAYCNIILDTRNAFLRCLLLSLYCLLSNTVYYLIFVSYQFYCLLFDELCVEKEHTCIIYLYAIQFQVVDFLNDVYICFDKIIDNFNVYKVYFMIKLMTCHVNILWNINVICVYNKVYVQPTAKLIR